MNRNYIFTHWAATLLIAPFLPTLYDFFFNPIKGEIIGLLDVYPIILLFSFILSLPTLIIYYFVFLYLMKRNANPVLTKVILIVLTIVGIAITILIIGGSLAMTLIYSFSISAFLTGILIRISNKTNPLKMVSESNRVIEIKSE